MPKRKSNWQREKELSVRKRIPAREIAIWLAAALVGVTIAVSIATLA
jgi:hypothetical protein